jgi:hypothetical protein
MALYDKLGEARDRTEIAVDLEDVPLRPVGVGMKHQ